MAEQKFKVVVRLQDGSSYIEMLDHPVEAKELAEKYRKEWEYDFIACRVDRKTKSLLEVLDHACMLELLDLRDIAAYRIYQASLSFLYVRAIQRLYGKRVSVSFENSLQAGVYTLVKGRGVQAEPSEILAEMRAMVDDDLPFVRSVVSRQELMQFFKEKGAKEDLRLFNSAPDIEESLLYTLDGVTEFCFHEMVPSTGWLKYFDVVRYKGGLLLQHPNVHDPKKIPHREVKKKLYGAYAENAAWAKIAGINCAADLNETVADGRINETVLLAEALQERKIVEIATEIVEKNKRFVLIAGPSSSGKTTFAKRLCIQLRVLGKKPLYLGTDDYFVERRDTPVGPDGKNDYETIEALDLELFNTQMKALMNGEKVDLPEFDFMEGTKVFGKRIVALGQDEPIVIEGIHGLNPKMTAEIDEENKYRIYISPLTQLNIDAHNRISTNDARLLRRIVRDHQFRGYSAARTIEAWPKVRTGEEKNIFPYTDQTDVFFNSHLLYELCILKSAAAPLLTEIAEDDPSYPEAQRLLDFLKFFRSLDDFGLVPNHSIMREFIGGSTIL